MSAALVVADMDEVDDRPSGRSTPTPSSMPGAGRLLELLGRYEVVIATLAVIVVITRLAGGGFVNHRIGLDPQAATVTPFADAADAADPPVVPGASPTPTTVVSGFDLPTPSLTVPSVRTLPGSAGAPVASAPAPAGDFARIPEPGAPAAVAVSSTGEVWVGTDNAGAAPVLFRLGADGSVIGRHAVTGVQQGITAVVSGDGGGAVFVAARTPAAVFRFDPASGAASPYATLPDVRPCLPPVVAADCDGAVIDAVPVPSAMAFAADGSLYVADAGQGAIWRVPAGGGEIEQWFVEVGWANATRPSGPSALAIDGAGNVVVALRGMLAEDVGAVFVVPVEDDGSAGEPTEIARTETGSQPAGLALGMSGRLYLSLAGAGVVVVLGPDGTEVGRHPAGGEKLDAPAALAFRGNELLVAVKGTGDPSTGRIFRLPIDEAGGPVHGGGAR